MLIQRLWIGQILKLKALDRVIEGSMSLQNQALRRGTAAKVLLSKGGDWRMAVPPSISKTF
jgi:hypothetical protein